MAEDWSAIASEVEDALREVGNYPVTLRRTSSSGGDPWNPTSTTEYFDLVCVEEYREVRDASGTLTDQTRRTLTLSATGVAPTDDDAIAVGLASADVDANTPFIGIAAVRPLAPAGTAVLYEVDLAS